MVYKMKWQEVISTSTSIVVVAVVIFFIERKSKAKFVGSCRGGSSSGGIVCKCEKINIPTYFVGKTGVFPFVDEVWQHKNST